MPREAEITIAVQRLAPDARLPQRASDAAAGADLFAAECITLAPGARHAVATGLAVQIPPGWYGRIAPRSGLAARHGIDTLAGVIDADYRGEVKVLLINLGSEPVTLQIGDRIAQLIIERAAVCEFVATPELATTERGRRGFGSTGA